jgi:hypothetical protein
MARSLLSGNKLISLGCSTNLSNCLASHPAYTTAGSNQRGFSFIAETAHLMHLQGQVAIHQMLLHAHMLLHRHQHYYLQCGSDEEVTLAASWTSHAITYK